MAYEPLTDEALASIRVLVVDDEATLRDACTTFLNLQGFNVTPIGRGEEALDVIKRRSFDIMLLDLYMTQVPGIELLQAALERKPETVVVMMTGNPSVGSSLEVLKAGAWDYLPKPFSASHLEVLIGRAAHAVMAQREQEPEHAELADPDGEAGAGIVVGQSRAIRSVLDLAKRVARSNASVFIMGESGSGKEMVAEFIHRHSRRAGRPLVPVNCAALPEPLLESEMFGHIRGAFTGAIKDKVGLFEMANGGTLFLDELSEMAPSIQAKLLRVIQDGVIRRVGSTEADAQVDVRILAATNRDPEEAVREGLLRHDLYYRLRVVPIRVPALRERTEDIPVLANHFLHAFWKRDNPRATPPVLTDEALAALRAHSWPGNTRELQNVVEHMAVLAEPGASMGAADIPFMTGGAGPSNGRRALIEHLSTDQPYHEAREELLSEFERSYLRSLVSRAGGNMARAARLAGVDRTTLYRLIDKHDLERGTILREK